MYSHSVICGLSWNNSRIWRQFTITITKTL